MLQDAWPSGSLPAEGQSFPPVTVTTENTLINFRGAPGGSQAGGNTVLNDGGVSFVPQILGA